MDASEMKKRDDLEPVEAALTPQDDAKSTSETPKESPSFVKEEQGKEDMPQLCPPSPSKDMSASNSCENGRREGRWWNRLGDKCDSNELRKTFFKDYVVGSYAEHLVGGRKDRFQEVKEPLTIAFYGAPGAGKSSTINTFMRVIEDEGEYAPVAGINDDEAGRTVRTSTTQNYLLGRDRDSQNGLIELWDIRGNCHIGHPERDIRLIRSLFLGVSGVGDDCVPDSFTSFKLVGPEIEPVGGFVRRPVNLVVFVLSAAAEEPERNHLNSILNVMNASQFPYMILVTKVDEKYGDGWSSSIKKLSGLPQNDTLYLENYTASKHRRSEHVDRKAMSVLFKILIAAERALMRKQKLSPAVHQVVNKFTSSKGLVGLLFIALAVLIGFLAFFLPFRF